jgi:hypothetical protein
MELYVSGDLHMPYLFRESGDGVRQMRTNPGSYVPGGEGIAGLLIQPER